MLRSRLNSMHSWAGVCLGLLLTMHDHAFVCTCPDFTSGVSLAMLCCSCQKGSCHGCDGADFLCSSQREASKPPSQSSGCIFKVAPTSLMPMPVSYCYILDTCWEPPEAHWVGGHLSVVLSGDNSQCLRAYFDSVHFFTRGFLQAGRGDLRHSAASGLSQIAASQQSAL